MHPFVELALAVKRFFRRPEGCQTGIKRELSELKNIAQSTSTIVAANHSILKKLSTDMQRDKKTMRKKKVRGAA